MTDPNDQHRAFVAELARRAALAAERGDRHVAQTVFDALLELPWQAPGQMSADLIRDALDAFVPLLDLDGFAAPAEHLYRHALAHYDALDASFSDRIVVLYNLQAVCAQRGDLDRRSRAASEAVRLAETYCGALTQRAVGALLTLIDVFEEAGQSEAVVRLYHPLAALAREGPDLSASTRVALLARYGAALSRVQRHREALDALRAAASRLGQLDEDAEHWRVRVLCWLAAAAAQTGETALAAHAYDEALGALEGGAPAGDRLRETLFFNAAVMWIDTARRERFDEAQQLLERSMALFEARCPQPDAERAVGRLQCARLDAARDQFDASLRAFREAVADLDAAPRGVRAMHALIAEASRRLALAWFDAQHFGAATDAWCLAARNEMLAGNGPGAAA